jgi:outer membrane protein TolC
MVSPAMPVVRAVGAALCGALFACCIAKAAEPLPVVHNGASRISLDSLVQEALDHNPEIRAAAQRHEAAIAVVPQSKSLPDPRIGVEYRDLDARETMYGFSQEVPFPGKLRLRGEVAAREAERTEQEYFAVRLRVIAALKEAYYDLHLTHKSIEIVDRNRELLVQFDETAKARYAVGQAAQQDLFRAQSEISRVLARLATLAQQRRSLEAEISRLLNRPAGDPLGVPEEVAAIPLRHTLTALNALVEEGAPLLRAQLKDVERSDRAVALARREYYPDVEVGVAGVREEPEGTDGYRLMVNLNVPLYFATKQREGVREAVADREAALSDLHAVKQELLFRIADNFAQVGRAAELIRLLEDALIPQARLTLAAAQAGYAVGSVDFLTLLNALLTLQENELELHQEAVEHEKARARIEEIIGGTP